MASLLSLTLRAFAINAPVTLTIGNAIVNASENETALCIFPQMSVIFRILKFKFSGSDGGLFA